MRWTFTVVGDLPGGDADVVVDVDPDATVDQLWSALTETLRPHGRPGPLFVDGTALPPAMRLAASPLRDGVVVGLGDPGAAPAPEPSGLVELRVVGGPDAGGVFRLPAGRAVIGSGAAATVLVHDPSLPAAAVLLEITELGGITVAPAPDLTVWLRGERLLEQRGWVHGAQLALGWTVLERVSPSSPDAVVRPAEDGAQRDYNRPPRWRPTVRPAPFRLPAAPTPPEPRPFPWLMALAPLVLAGVLVLVLGNLLFLGFALLSPVLVVGNHLTERRHGGRSHRRRLAEHGERVDALEDDAREALAAEEAARRWDSPDPAVVLLTAAGPRSRLWERRREDPDFLRLRVGTGDLPSGIVLDDPARPEHRRSWTWVAVDVPVLVPLRERGVLGVAGPGELPRAVARWLVAQAATLHSPRDLLVVVLTDAGARASWAWARWLPHARTADVVSVAADAETVADRALELAAVVAARKRALRETPNAVLADPDLLVVLDGAGRLRRVPGVLQVLTDGPAVGVFAVCLDADERMLPGECAAVVTAGPAGGLRVRQADEEPVENVRPELVGTGWSERVARGLAPLRDSSGTEESSLPDTARLLDLLALEPPTGDAVAARWAGGGRSTAALVGVGLDGPFTLDLRRDGPHALIAGTTGAGKSELLQTLVATLAVTNRPDALMFVLVDYKGGSAFADCAQLPHTGGMVTDLDAHLVERALTSLSAELRRRERMLADAGAPDLEAYLRVAGSRPERPTLPRLVIVIDEFASLVRELPDFVTGLVDLARRGRSLGIHLVLATQRPGGVVSPEIRANTDLRIALRVTDAAESVDVVDSADAVRIGKGQPGRAYARGGGGELTRFQTARIGGRRRTTRVRTAPPRPWVATLPPARLGHPAPRPPERARDEEEVTDLAVLVEAVRKAAETTGLAPQPSPWLPPLPASVVLDDLPVADADAGRLAPVAFALDDLPARQEQRPAVLDLASFGHLFVVGAPRTGRSQVLRTIGGAIGRAHSAADVHLYGIDCGNGALLPLAELPHCGAVVRAAPAERATRLIARLVTELQRRVELLGEEGFASVVEQRAAVAPPQRLPHVVVLLDRWERFTVALGEVDAGRLTDDIGRILREGASAGLHLVVAGDRSLLTGRMSTLTEAKLVLRVPDRADFSLVGINPRTVPDAMPPGRALWGESGVETQVALLDPDASGQGQGTALARIAERARERDADLPAARLPFRVDVLPTRIGFDRAWAMRAGPPDDGADDTAMWALVGVGGDTLRAHGPDLAVGVPGFVVAGPPSSGRSTVLVTMARSLRRSGIGVVAVAPRRSPLRDLEGTVLLTGTELAPDDLADALEQAGERAAVLVDDAETLRDCAAGGALAALLRAGSGSGRAVVIAGDVDGVCAGFSGWQLEVKKARRGLLLAPRASTDGDLVGARVPRSAVGPPVAVGRGLLHLGDGELLTVQVPHTG